MGATEKFWSPYKIGGKRSQPGNPRADGELPSSKISPTKAKEILRHGTVRGHKLTPKQKGLFGAAAGRSKKR